jgi:cell division protein FtsI (penicillin-binding protein 3)
MNSRYQWRAYLVYLFLSLMVCGLIWRLVDLNLVNRFFLLKQSDARILRTETLVAHRGVITDREGTVLAMSTPVYSVWVNPKYFQATQSQLNALARSLELPISTIKSRTNPASGKEFVYLKRQNSPDVMEATKISAFLSGR